MCIQKKIIVILQMISQTSQNIMLISCTLVNFSWHLNAREAIKWCMPAAVNVAKLDLVAGTFRHGCCLWSCLCTFHDDIIKWKHFPRYWPFVGGIYLWLVDSPQKGQWRGALMFSFIRAWTTSWANNGGTSDSRCYFAHYDVTLMLHIFVKTE